MPKKINLRTLLKFYDEKDFAPSLHASSVKSVLGEDLAIALLSHYFKANGCSVRILSEACNQGTKTGCRLDKWAEINSVNQTTIFQVEIKNWSVHSLGGKSISIHANEEAMRDFRIARWARRFDSKKNVPAEKSTSKVLTKMKLPEGYSKAEHKALLCFWESLHPIGKAVPLFEVDVNSESFDRLTVFSMSNYVRQLLESTEVLAVEMKDTDSRIDWINKIYC